MIDVSRSREEGEGGKVPVGLRHCCMGAVQVTLQVNNIYLTMV